MDRSRHVIFALYLPQFKILTLSTGVRQVTGKLDSPCTILINPFIFNIFSNNQITFSVSSASYRQVRFLWMIWRNPWVSTIFRMIRRFQPRSLQVTSKLDSPCTILINPFIFSVFSYNQITFSLSSASYRQVRFLWMIWKNPWMSTIFRMIRYFQLRSLQVTSKLDSPCTILAVSPQIVY